MTARPRRPSTSSPRTTRPGSTRCRRSRARTASRRAARSTPRTASRRPDEHDLAVDAAGLLELVAAPRIEQREPRRDLRRDLPRDEQLEQPRHVVDERLAVLAIA